MVPDHWSHIPCFPSPLCWRWGKAVGERWVLLREASPIQPHMPGSPKYASLGVEGLESSLSHCCWLAPRLCYLVGEASSEMMQGAVWVLSCALRQPQS